MIPMISPRAMRECEERYFDEGGVASIDVMERAAQALADAMAVRLREGARIYFACGVGGNGGDGLACARLLHGKYGCVIVLPREPRSTDAAENLRRARACGIPVLNDWDDLPCPDAWVDALFGTGLSREPEGAEARLTDRINANRDAGAQVFAADIPSGLNGRTGRAFAHCICADETVAFQYLKWGHKLNDGMDCCGGLTVADVGFPESAFAPEIHLTGPEDISRTLPVRPRNCHKGSCGHLLIVAGSFGMAGAAILCASAALRSGAGLVTIACVRSIVPILQMAVPQAMCIPLDEREGAIAPEALPQLEQALKGKTAAVIGCGLTRRVPPEIIRAVLTSGIPAVVDADALNILSENPELFALLKREHVLTPHPGEAVRLIPGLSADDPVAAARELSGLGATALYKGASCVVTDGDAIYVSASGGSGMARGGSGDVLSGIMGALLADPKHGEITLVAAVASEIHGLAGERAQAKYGSFSMNSRDILEFLPEVFPK